jgi:hypothetical protein
VESPAWDESHRLWRGIVNVGSATRVEVSVFPGDVEPSLALSYAEFALTLIAHRIDEARQFAARRLVGDYNDWNAHLPDGEELTLEQFAGRLRLEGIRFRGEGVSSLDFAHDFYRGDYLFEGGLIVVEATAEGRFVRPRWVTEADAEECRRTRRCSRRQPRPGSQESMSHGAAAAAERWSFGEARQPDGGLNVEVSSPLQECFRH